MPETEVVSGGVGESGDLYSGAGQVSLFLTARPTPGHETPDRRGITITLQHSKPITSGLIFLSFVSCDSSVGGAMDKLDSQIKYLINSLEGSLDTVISGLRSDCQSSRLQTQTYGWAIVTGGALDIAAEQISNDLTAVITNPEVTYSYGYYAAYAMGFAGPYLLPTYIGSCSFDCSSVDFNTVVNKYNLRNGISYQNVGASKLQSFGIDAKQALR